MTSIIKGKATTFTATRLSSAVDGTFVGMYNAESGIVTIVFSIRMSSDTSTTTALWTIPSEYRPKVSVYFPVLVYNGANVPIAFQGVIEASGKVYQNASGSGRQVYGVAIYKI